MKGCCCCFRKLPVEHFNQREFFLLYPARKQCSFSVFFTPCVAWACSVAQRILASAARHFSPNIFSPARAAHSSRSVNWAICKLDFFFSTDAESLHYSSSQSSRISLIWQFHPCRSNPKRGRKKQHAGFALERMRRRDVRCEVKAQQLRFLDLIFGMFLAFTSGAVIPCVIFKSVVL